MRGKIVWLILSLSLSGFLFSASNFKLDKDVTVAPQEIYDRDVISFSGHIDIKGKFQRSLILFGGSLKLDGEVGQDVVCIGSKVEIGAYARVKGDLFIIGGTLARDAGAQVNGEFTYLRFDLKKIESTLSPIFQDARSIPFFKIIRLFIWFIVALIVIAIVPRHVYGAGEMLGKHPMRVGLIGFLSLCCFLFLLFTFFILVFVLVGIPLLLALIILYFIISVFGRTVIFYFIGEKISGLVKLKNPAPTLLILFGLFLFGLITFLPLVGPLIMFVVNILEVGIGVGFFLRKKLRLI